MKYKLIIGTLLATVFGAQVAAQPVSAVGERSVREIRDTFVEEDVNDDSSSLTFGHNLLLAGNSFESKANTSGLLLSAGNIMDLGTKSEYAFVAGNAISIEGEVEKDLFVAGNSITIDKAAKIGRDIFAAGSQVYVETDHLNGDLSVTAGKVAFRTGTVIDGNVNLAVGDLVVDGKVEIKGKLVINSDATIHGESNLSYAEISKYEPDESEVEPAGIFISAILGIIALFIVFVIILAMYPRIDQKVEHELSSLQFGKDLVIGICALFLIPVISVFLFISVIGSLAGVVLTLAYIIMLCLSQAFAGFWLGKLIMEKAFHNKVNPFLEALIGIVILQAVGLIPFVGGYVTLIAVVTGLGIILQCLRGRAKKVEHRHSTVEEAEVVEEKVTIAEKPKAKKAHQDDRDSKEVKTEE